jgi:hypothetical protein
MTFRRTAVVSALVLATCTVQACRKTPTTPSLTSVSGTWIGTTTGPGFTGAAARFTLSEQGTEVTGTFSARIGAVDVVNGSLTGITSPGLVGLQHIAPPTGTCPDGSRPALTVIIRLFPASSAMTGTYSSSSCSGAVNGDIAITRQ